MELSKKQREKLSDVAWAAYNRCSSWETIALKVVAAYEKMRAAAVVPKGIIQIPPDEPKSSPKRKKPVAKCAAALLACLLTATDASAVTVLFSDDFSGATIGLNVGSSAVPGWTVAPSVDVVGPGLYDIVSCHSETHCLDMDGTGGLGGAISRQVNLTAGRPYLLTVWVSGSQRDPAVYGAAAATSGIRLSINGQSTDLVLPWNHPWSPWAMPYSPLVDETVTVSITGFPNANVGLLIDDAILVDTTNGMHTPEPGYIFLATASLAAMLALRPGRRSDFLTK